MEVESSSGIGCSTLAVVRIRRRLPRCGRRNFSQASFGSRYVWLISASLAGFFRGRLSRFKRTLFGIAGLMALVPEGAFEGALLTDVIGIVAFVGLATFILLR